MTVFVFGANGMLGRYVYAYLNLKDYNVVKVTREDVNAVTCTEDDLFYMFSVKPGDVFINCVGVIPQRGEQKEHVFTAVNGSFPYALNDYCRKANLHLIHATTDCVFSGLSGRYDEHDPHDADDIYGRSKSFGEPSTATVIRTSIIGEEIENKKSLLEWVKSQAGGRIGGYVNHMWNGVTCLQFAKVCEEIIKTNNYWKGVRHVPSPDSVSKWQLVTMINSIYDLDIDIYAAETDVDSDKTITTVYKDAQFDIPMLYDQILEQRDFYTTLKDYS